MSAGRFQAPSSARATSLPCQSASGQMHPCGWNSPMKKRSSNRGWKILRYSGTSLPRVVAHLGGVEEREAGHVPGRGDDRVELARAPVDEVHRLALEAGDVRARMHLAVADEVEELRVEGGVRLERSVLRLGQPVVACSSPAPDGW